MEISTRSRIIDFDVAAHIADFGELAGFHFQERRIGELRQPARDLGFADAGGPDHEDVLRHHLFGHLGLELLAADAVAERDGDGAFGVGLADDVLVEFATISRGVSSSSSGVFSDGLCWADRSPFTPAPRR